MANKLYRSRFTFNGIRYERTSTKSQREADRKANQFRRDLESGNIGITSRMRVQEWTNEWLEVYKKPAVTEKGYKNYKRFVDNIINPYIGGLRLNEVTDVHLQKIMNGRAGNSHSDVKHLRDTIIAIFRKARESKLITHDPSEFLQLPAAQKKTRRSLTSLELEHFLNIAETHPSGLMFKTMLYCGLRTGEVTALSWKDIDFDNRMINVVAAMESGKDELKTPKTAAGVRKVPIPDDIYYALLERKGDPFKPVFTQQTTGRRHTESSRTKAWNSLKRQMDISMGAKTYRSQIIMSVVATDLVPYCLRHTYCTNLQDKGISINIAKYLMGHSDISVTANVYTYITDDAIREAAKTLGVSYRVTSAETDEKTIVKPSPLHEETA